MRLFEALKVFCIQDNTLTRQKLKTKFKELCLVNHPDKGGSNEKMQIILEAFAILKEQYSFVVDSNNSNSENEYQQDSNFWSVDSEEMKQIYLKIRNLAGIEIEICGSWLWVTGNSFAHKAYLKEIGMFYAPKKKAWYWKPEDSYCVSNGKLSLSYIRNKYGSTSLETSNFARIEG